MLLCVEFRLKSSIRPQMRCFYFLLGVFLVELPSLLIGKIDPDAFLAKRLIMIFTSVMRICFLHLTITLYYS